MPRSNLCKSKAEIANEKLYRWLKHQETQTAIGKAIGLSRQVVNYKINNFAFTTIDLLKIFHFLGTDPSEIAKLMTY